jgi:hypothetical protein
MGVLSNVRAHGDHRRSAAEADPKPSNFVFSN